MRWLALAALQSSQLLKISSQDEIGVLSTELNELIDALHKMSTFKKVIEEDDNIIDVYSRLGGVFRNIGLNDFTFFDVTDKKMEQVYPIPLPDGEISCNEEIFNNCELCRAARASHLISSIDYPHICKQFRTELGKEHICLPISAGSNTGGVVQFIFEKTNISEEKKKIDRKISKAQEYINESLYVIEAKRLMNSLKESAVKDSLTGLYNRRILQESSDTIVSGVLRRKKLIGFIMCDLDYFKQINDTYGHDVGDILLKETANIIEKSVRGSDLVIRFGGDEFLVLLLDLEEHESMKISEKIRENIGNMEVKIPDGVLNKTMSLGVSEFPTDTDDFWQALKFADVALYNAKDAGRNQTVRFAQEMWTEEQS